MRLSELQDKKVKTLDGKSLGRVHEVHCDKGRITALTCGPGSFLERLTAREHGGKIEWECVRRIDEHEIVVAPRKPSGSRTQQRTPRPSARRSRR